MSRKPQIAVSPFSGQDAAWSGIRRLHGRGPWTIKQVEYESDQPRKTIMDYVKRLIAGGVVERTGERPDTKEATYRVLADSLDTPRFTRDGKPVVRGRGNEQMWRAMKMIGVFTPRELALAAGTEDAPVSAETALTYAKFLCRAGYLAMVADSYGPTCQRRYRFVAPRNTGPHAPRISKINRVRIQDGNTGKVMWEGEVKDV